MSVPGCLFALAFVLAGALLLGIVSVGTIVFLTGRHCGPAFSYYGCETPPTAKIRSERNQVAPSEPLSGGTRKAASEFGVALP